MEQIGNTSLPISALQHFLFCPRQCALIHTENVWQENVLTAEGRILHERADSGKSDRRRRFVIARSLQICSVELGIHGVADIVEYEREQRRVVSAMPVEYKRGRPKSHRADEVQLCAQVLCLEEMHGVSIPEAMLYYGMPQRRTPVVMDEELRELTKTAIVNLRELLLSGKTPAAAYSKPCEKCSLLDLCLPKTEKKNTLAWNDSRFEQSLNQDFMI